MAGYVIKKTTFEKHNINIMKNTIAILLFVFLSKITFAQINTTSYAPKVDFASGVGTSNPAGVIAVDLDSDGKNDVVSANFGIGSISVYRNTSTSTAISLATKVDYATFSSAAFIHPADLDGDGKTDLVISYNAGTAFSYFRNTTTTVGTITFATRQDVSALSFTNDFDIADVDGDLKVDLICSNYNSGNFSVFRNTSISGTVSFATRVDFSCGSNPSSITVFDVDGDTKKDVAVTNYTSSQVSVYRNTTITIGSPSFSTTGVTVSTGNYPAFLANADLDGDGKMDMVTGNYVSNNISVIKNTTSFVGSITFQASVNITAGSGTSSPQGITLADFDNDRKKDIGVCNNANNNISVFKNISTTGVINTSSFASQVNFGLNSGPLDIFSSDINGDGKLDILVSNNGSNNISILRNQIIANEPTVSASNLVFSNSTSTSTTITFTKGNGSRRIVLAKAVSAVNSTPLD